MAVKVATITQKFYVKADYDAQASAITDDPNVGTNVKNLVKDPATMTLSFDVYQ